MGGFWNGLRTLQEALAGLDDPHGERFARLEQRLRELEERLDQMRGDGGGLPERPISTPPTQTFAAAE